MAQAGGVGVMVLGRFSFHTLPIKCYLNLSIVAVAEHVHQFMATVYQQLVN